MQDSAHLSLAHAAATAAPSRDPVGSLAEISRKWLADISPENFAECHGYLAAVRLARHMSKIDVCRASQSNATPPAGCHCPLFPKLKVGPTANPAFAPWSDWPVAMACRWPVWRDSSNKVS